MTIIEIIKQSEEYLTKKNVESSRLISELILSHFLKLERLELYTNFDKPLDEAEIEILRDKILRAGKHEPIQYILGNTNFLGLNILCDKRALIPRPETEELTKIIESEITKQKTCLEIGAGSGCISIYLAKQFPKVQFTALDISTDAISLAEENAAQYELTNLRFFEADIFKKIPQKKYDIFISNPPYISTSEISELDTNVKEFEPLLALDGGYEGVTFYKHFASIIQRVLNDNGKFYFEFGIGQEKMLLEIFENYQTEFRDDFTGRKRFLLGTYVKK